MQGKEHAMAWTEVGSGSAKSATSNMGKQSLHRVRGTPIAPKPLGPVIGLTFLVEMVIFLGENGYISIPSHSETNVAEEKSWNYKPSDMVHRSWA